MEPLAPKIRPVDKIALGERMRSGERNKHPLAGIVALSTYLMSGERLPAEQSAENAHLPIFFGHGSVDPVVPQALGVAARDALVKLGHAVAWHSYPMAHQVCAEEILDLRNWMGAHLASATD